MDRRAGLEREPSFRAPGDGDALGQADRDAAGAVGDRDDRRDAEAACLGRDDARDSHDGPDRRGARLHDRRPSAEASDRAWGVVGAACGAGVVGAASGSVRRSEVRARLWAGVGVGVGAVVGAGVGAVVGVGGMSEPASAVGVGGGMTWKSPATVTWIR